MRVRVKICGITSVKDALSACEAGVDAIGLVFYEKSPRNIQINTAKSICAALPPFVSTVGLFLNADQETVQTVLEKVPLDLLQFHGTESPEFCSRFSRPYIKAVGMQNTTTEQLTAYTERYLQARGFLVDSHPGGQAGGTGKTFDWNRLPRDFHKPIILAGGLNPDNVAQALAAVDVYGLDLSSGVESQPGVKDSRKIRQLMEEVKRVQCYEKQ